MAVPALPPPPLKERLIINLETQDRQSGSLYKRPDNTGQAANNQDGWLLIGASLAWSKWLQDAQTLINIIGSATVTITCGSDVNDLNTWICGLWADDQALQAAVLALQSDVSTINGRLDSVAVTVCATPFTQSMEDTFQAIIDQIYFDLGSGCAPVVDYITDIYSILNGGNFMPLDANGSGVVPDGQGIYSNGTTPAGMALGPDAVFYDLLASAEMGAFLSFANIGPVPGGATAVTNLVILAFDGVSTAQFQCVADVGTGVIRLY